jgi:hypothetical protein
MPAFPWVILICFTTLHLPSDNFWNEPHGAWPVGVVGAGDAALGAGALCFGVGDDPFDGAADREPACSHSMWTVNGRAMSPTSAGDNCCSDRAVRNTFAIQECSRHFGLDGKVHVLRNVPRKTGYAHGVKFRSNNPDEVTACVKQRSAAVTGLHGRADLKIPRIITKPRESTHIANREIGGGG